MLIFFFPGFIKACSQIKASACLCMCVSVSESTFVCVSESAFVSVSESAFVCVSVNAFVCECEAEYFQTNLQTNKAIWDMV